MLKRITKNAKPDMPTLAIWYYPWEFVAVNVQKKTNLLPPPKGRNQYRKLRDGCASRCRRGRNWAVLQEVVGE